MEDVNVPVAWASTEENTLPEVCARHGDPAEETQHVEFGGMSPGWLAIAGVAALAAAILIGVVVTPVLAGVPVLALVVVFGKTRARTRLAWPYCARCVALHDQVTVLRRVVAAFLLLGVFAAVQRIRTYGVDGTTTSMMVGLSVGLLILLLVAAAFSWPQLAGAKLSRDRLSLRVNAHPRFAAAVRDRLAAERVTGDRTR